MPTSPFWPLIYRPWAVNRRPEQAVGAAGGHAHTASIERSSSWGTSTRRWRPSLTTVRPPTTTCCTSAAVAPNTTPATTWSAWGAGQPGRVEGDGGEVGQCPDLDPAALGPAQAAVALGRGHGQQAGRRVGAPLARGQALVQLDGPGLLEGVDDGVGVGADAERRAPVPEGGRRPDPVGQVPFGGGADAAPRAGAGQDGQVLVAQVGGVHGGEPIAQGAVVGQDPGRVEAVGGAALLVLGRLLAEVGVQGSGGAVGPRRDHLDGHRVDRPHRVDGRPDPARVGRPQLVDPRRPRRRVPVAEPPLHRVQNGAEGAGVEVAGVEEGQAEAGGLGGGPDGLAHLVGVGVGRPSGPWWR